MECNVIMNYRHIYVLKKFFNKMEKWFHKRINGVEITFLFAEKQEIF
jgi:hypothetical protein